MSSGLKVERLTPDGQTAIYTTFIGTVGTDFFWPGGVAATAQGGYTLARAPETVLVPTAFHLRGAPQRFGRGVALCATCNSPGGPDRTLGTVASMSRS